MGSKTTSSSSLISVGTSLILTRLFKRGHCRWTQLWLKKEDFRIKNYTTNPQRGTYCLHVHIYDWFKYLLQSLVKAVMTFKTILRDRTWPAVLICASSFLPGYRFDPAPICLTSLSYVRGLITMIGHFSFSLKVAATVLIQMLWDRWVYSIRVA